MEMFSKSFFLPASVGGSSGVSFAMCWNTGARTIGSATNPTIDVGAPNRSWA